MQPSGRKHWGRIRPGSKPVSANCTEITYVKAVAAASKFATGSGRMKNRPAGPLRPPEAEFVRQVRAAFLKPACVHSVFTAADEKLALNLYRREVSLEQVRRAVWLGCARKYVAMLNRQTRQPITSLAYFASLIEEVQQAQIPGSYWDHVRHRMEAIEKRWLQTVNQPQAAGTMTEPPAQEML